MSSHPNVMLQLVLTPDNLARKTYRAILDGEGISDDDDEIKINGTGYRHKVMEDDYDDDNQISAKEGDIVIFDLVTYGYGEKIEWQDLEARKTDLEAWATTICDKHQCSQTIFITANYW